MWFVPGRRIESLA
jgi:hypothetical protein